MLLLEDRRFYVYVYLDPRKPGNYNYGPYHFDYEPFYVGKGQGRRIKDHINEALRFDKEPLCSKEGNKHKNNKILKIIKSKYNVITLKIKEFLNEKEALELEKLLIRIIGRSDVNEGPLTNLIDGGKEGCRRVLSLESREKMSNARRGKTIEEIVGEEKAIELKKEYSKRSSGKNNGMYGKHHTDSTKEKIRKCHTGRSSPIKGKTYEEFYGVEKANEIKSKNIYIKDNRKGKTFEEEYGEDRAKEIKLKLSKSVSKAKTINIDLKLLIDLFFEKIPNQELSKYFGMSITTLQRRLRLLGLGEEVLPRGRNSKNYEIFIETNKDNKEFYYNKIKDIEIE